MKILIALTYYWPYVSGLDMYVKKLAEALVKQGHQVSIITSRYDGKLEKQETINGVQVVRVPIQFWISKGAIMLGYLKYLIPMIRNNEIVVMNLPNTFVETFLIGLVTRLIKRPVVGIYHCDIHLSGSTFNRLVNFVVHCVNRVGATFVDRLTLSSEDFILPHFNDKRIVIPPPVDIAEPDPVEVKKMREKYAPKGEPIIGYCGRVSAEKGLHFLIESLPYIQEKYPDIKIVFAGDFSNVIGEKEYFEQLKPLLKKYEDSIVLLGYIPDSQLPDFYGSCNVFVLPSINNTETFGLVQVESMLCGTPVVASDLPGVRVPVTITGMGEITPPRDSHALAQMIIKILDNRDRYILPRKDVEEKFSTKRTVDDYIEVFSSLVHKT